MINISLCWYLNFNIFWTGFNKYNFYLAPALQKQCQWDIEFHGKDSKELQVIFRNYLRECKHE